MGGQLTIYLSIACEFKQIAIGISMFESYWFILNEIC